MVDYIVFSQQIMKTLSTMHYVDNFMQAVYWKMNTTDHAVVKLLEIDINKP